VKLQADEFDVITPSRLFLKSAFLGVKAAFEVGLPA